MEVQHYWFSSKCLAIQLESKQANYARIEQKKLLKAFYNAILVSYVYSNSEIKTKDEQSLC